MRAIVNESLQAGQTSTIHKFELGGLGKGPFHFTGEVTEKTYQACPGAPVQAGSNCDYCGTCIRYEFWIMSSDNKRSKVGCDCIHKTGDAGLIKQISIAERKLRDVKNAAAKQRKIAKLNERIDAAKSLLSSVRGKLTEQSHPNSYYASQGKTMLDYVNWCFENHAGERACFIVENAAK